MSVRRLAQVQPASFAFTPSTLKAARGWMANFPAGVKRLTAERFGTSAVTRMG